jgi:hypothetical protein
VDDMGDAILLCSSVPPTQAGYLVTRYTQSVSIGGRILKALPPVANNWKTATTYGANAQVNSHQGVYLTAAGGTSASSGTGPSGTGQAIVDNTVTWQFIGPVQTTLTAYGSLQPVSGAELDRLPEEYRTKEVRAFWTPTLLRTSGLDGNGEADIVTAEGYQWQVTPVQTWENLGLYRKVLLVRVGR